jgi:hypothetical protein
VGKPTEEPVEERKNELDKELERLRTICDLRIMHGRVDELHNLVKSLQDGRHSAVDICHFSDPKRLKMNIDHIDEIYLWFVNLKSEFNCNKKLITNGNFVA